MTLYRLSVTYPDGKLDSEWWDNRADAESRMWDLRRHGAAVSIHEVKPGHVYKGVLGGQGRTAASVRSDGTAVWLTMAAILVLLALCAIREATS